MKKILAILCALAMTASCVSGMVFAEDASENLFLGASVVSTTDSGLSEDTLMSAVDGDYNTQCLFGRAVNSENPGNITLTFAETKINKICIVSWYAAGDGSIKLYDADGEEIAVTGKSKNAYNYRRHYTFTFDEITTSSITVSIVDVGNKSDASFIEVEGYYVPDADAEIEFELLRDAENKNVVDVAIITSVSQTEAESYTKLVYKISVYNFINGKAITKKDMSTDDNNVYDSVLIGTNEYVASSINADDSYVGAVVLEDIEVQTVENPDNSSGAIVFVQVFGVDAQGAETALTGLYRLDIPYEA